MVSQNQKRSLEKETLKKVSNWGWKDITVDKALVLHAAGPESLLGIAYVLQSLPRVIPEHCWAWPQNKIQKMSSML